MFREHVETTSIPKTSCGRYVLRLLRPSRVWGRRQVPIQKSCLSGFGFGCLRLRILGFRGSGFRVGCRVSGLSSALGGFQGSRVQALESWFFVAYKDAVCVFYCVQAPCPPSPLPTVNPEPRLSLSFVEDMMRRAAAGRVRRECKLGIPWFEGSGLRV